MKEWFFLFWKKLLENIKNSHDLCARILYVVLCILVISIISLIFLQGVIPITKVYNGYFTVSIEEKKELTQREKNSLNDLIAKNKVISVSDVYSRTLHYYDSFITVLVALLGAFAILSWISLKTKIREEVQNEITNFFNSPQTVSWMNDLMKKQIDDREESLFTNKNKLIEDVEDAVWKKIENRKNEEI